MSKEIEENAYDIEDLIDDDYDSTGILGELNVNEENEGKVFLSEIELLNINLRSEQTKVFERDNEITNLKIHLIDTQKKMLENKIESLEKDKVILGFGLRDDKKLQEAFREDTRKTLKEISSNHNISPLKKWGFNPESGEIVVDDK